MAVKTGGDKTSQQSVSLSRQLETTVVLLDERRGQVTTLAMHLGWHVYGETVVQVSVQFPSAVEATKHEAERSLSVGINEWLHW